MEINGTPVGGDALPDIFNIDKAFNKFLEMIGIDQRKAPYYKLREMRRAFYGAWGMKMLFDREAYDLYPDEKEFTKFIHQQTDMVKAYWEKEISDQFFQ
jgi:hypothetical protein